MRPSPVVETTSGSLVPARRSRSASSRNSTTSAGTVITYMRKLSTAGTLMTGAKASAGLYKLSVAVSIATNTDDSAYDELDIWKASHAVIARYRRDDVTDRIMYDDHGLPEIV